MKPFREQNVRVTQLTTSPVACRRGHQQHRVEFLTPKYYFKLQIFIPVFIQTNRLILKLNILSKENYTHYKIKKKKAIHTALIYTSLSSVEIYYSNCLRSEALGFASATDLAVIKVDVPAYVN